MEVALLNWMGDDNTVASAARVSFDKDAKNYSDEQNIKLIKYLASHGHWTPFGHVTATFRIKAPLFVAAQLKKHQVGLVWNEVSRRYVDVEPEFYVPEKWRGRPVNKKQGSSGAPYMTQDIAKEDYERALWQCKFAYHCLINGGVAPEMARMVLPQATYTEWYWTGSLYAFSRVCNLRLAPDAQEEARVIVQKIYDELIKIFPVSMKELVKIEAEERKS